MQKIQNNKKKLIRISTVPESLNGFCKGQLNWLKNYYEVVAISSPLPELKEMEGREKIRCIPLPMERHISIFKDIRSLIKMTWILHKEKPFIVHSMTPKAGLISMIAAWINRVPIRMHTYTGLVFPTASGAIQKILILTDKILCFCANYINPEGQGVAKDLKKYNITKKHLHIIGHGNVRGIDPEYWNPIASTFKLKPALSLEEGIDISSNKYNIRKVLGLNKDAFIFSFVGRLVGDKGINELIVAFRKLQEKLINITTIQLVLVGPYENELDPLKENTLQTIKNNKDIFVFDKQTDVRPFYNLADVFVFPSYREGFPNTVLEAGAMGLPQIVTDINGANEIIRDGLNGKIVQPRSSKALYEAMLWFINHPKERQRMANNARRMVIDRFNQKYLWNELLKVYQSFDK